MSEKHKNRSSWLFSQSLYRRNTSSILQKQDKKRNTSFMNELCEIARISKGKDFVPCAHIELTE
jgi:hypothetical protein